MGILDAADRIRSARSLLFVPGDRPDRFEKAEAAGADLVIIDLEDAVAPQHRAAALAHAVAWLRAGHEAVVRINAVGEPTHEAEVVALKPLKPILMLPKVDSCEHLATFTHDAWSPAWPVVPLIETARGVNDASAIASVDGAGRLAFGSIDLAAELGVDPNTRDSMMYARNRLVYASAAAELPSPIDGVTTLINDEAQLADDLREAVRLGMGAKLCIHPGQVATVNEGFAPTTEQIAWATRVLSVADGGGATSVDGEMIDSPVIARARRLLRRTNHG